MVASSTTFGGLSVWEGEFFCCDGFLRSEGASYFLDHVPDFVSLFVWLCVGRFVCLGFPERVEEVLAVCVISLIEVGRLLIEAVVCEYRLFLFRML